MMLFLLGSAYAFTGDVRTVELPVVARRIVVLPRGARTLVVALGDTGTALIEDGAVVEVLPIPASDAALLDLDGDGLRELLLCTADALVAVGWEGPGDAHPVGPACTDLVVHETTVLTARAGAAVEVFALEAGALADQGPYGDPLGGTPILVDEGTRVGIGAIGRDGVVERSAYGRSTLATGGAIGGLAMGPSGWLWTLPETSTVADLTHRIVPVGPSPSAVVAARLAPGEARELLVLHPAELGRIRWVGGISLPEEREPLPIPADQLLAADLDGDACDEILLAGGSKLAIARSDACPAPGALAVAAPVAPVLPSLPPPPDLSARRGGAPLRPFLGQDSTDVYGFPRTDVQFGVGWAFGGTLGPVWTQIGAFPAVAFTAESGGPLARWVFGIDSAGFFLWIGENGGGVHLGNVLIGTAFGGRNLAIGPFVTAGVYDAGAGIRTVFTPWEGHTGTRQGFEARLTWFAPRTGEAMLLYVWRSPLDPSQHPTATRPAGPAFCRRFGFAVGGAGAVSSTERSWEFVGSDAKYTSNGSFAVAGTCESGRHAGILMGIESAPFLSYVTPPDGDRVHHMASYTLGATIGTDAIRVGPIATAGFWVLGAGGRLAFTPFQTGSKVHHGLDLRALMLFPDGPSYEAMAMYGFSIDPRR